MFALTKDNQKIKKYLLFNVVMVCIVALLYFFNNTFFKHLSPLQPLSYFLNCYFYDLICPFGYLAGLNLIAFFTLKEFRIVDFWRIQLWTLVAGLIWEYVAPLLKPTSVTDLLDLLCYQAGAVGYYFINRFYVKNILIQEGE